MDGSSTIVYFLAGYMMLVNVYGFLLMHGDKKRAKQRAKRIPEKRFFIVALLGGAIGAWCGMKVWRHKTKHRSFTIGMPCLAAVNVLAIVLIMQNVVNN
ncbi:DUF1294 domain-containing protein [Paenibacillus sp. GCM10027627]|uniref:DUF1294 domain-containing protein n=1 Tax=unclassified Paenibacillus TaxID=185978 RepID=UPI0036334E39